MKNDNIRKTIIDYHSTIKELMLSDFQYHLLYSIKHKYKDTFVCSSLLADRFNKTVQNISTQLAKLHSKGYLDREKIDSESGGIEYIYKSIF